MGDKSKIEWTEATWNPIVGCSVVSPGCADCYAARVAGRIEKAMPKTTDTEGVMNAVADGLDKIFNGVAAQSKPVNGFVLLVFPLDAPEGARVNYASNAKRADIVSALKEIVARFEGQPEAKGRA